MNKTFKNLGVAMFMKVWGHCKTQQMHEKACRKRSNNDKICPLNYFKLNNYVNKLLKSFFMQDKFLISVRPKKCVTNL